MNDTETKQKCPQCNKPIETPIVNEIIQRDRREPSGLRRTKITFCSQQCGSHYQMGCEG